ncbi:hypothetical protein B0H13DRAFT_1901447 [Mycena leptocephala]|nr:hypothetical protein B0H13DRAFT_1901447 [Mycena leptocephala]
MFYNSPAACPRQWPSCARGRCPRHLLQYDSDMIHYTPHGQSLNTVPKVMAGSAASPLVPISKPNSMLEDGYRKQFIVDNRMCFVDLIDTVGRDCCIQCDIWRRVCDAAGTMYTREPGIHIQSHRGQHSTDLKSSKKSDNSFEHEVSKNQGAALERRLGCEFIETSAKTAQNAERVFTKLNLVRALRAREIPRTTDSEKEEVPHLASS